MTDQLPPDRAEQAFRDAFAAHADDAPFVRLTVPTRRGVAWGRYLSVAATVVLFALAGTVIVRMAGGSATGTSAVAPAGAPAPATGQEDSQVERATAGAAGAPTESALPLPAPRAGWRFESFRNLVFQVPQGWGYAPAINADWCAADPRPAPTKPFVDIARGVVPVRAIACPTAIPADQLVMHLTFAENPDDKLPYTLPKGWTMSQSAQPGAVVRIVHPSGEQPLADEILATITPVTADHNGCPVASPIQQPRFLEPQPGGPLAEVSSVDSISVCQYGIGSSASPGLQASTVLTGASAAAELAALKASPAHGGPDDPSACVGDAPEFSAVVLRLRSGEAVREVYVYYTSCVHNGFFDGVQARALNRAACSPLFREPVWISVGFTPSVDACRAGLDPEPTPSK